MSNWTVQTEGGAAVELTLNPTVHTWRDGDGKVGALPLLSSECF